VSSRLRLIVSVLAAVALLAGCDSSNMSDLKAFVARVKAHTSSEIKPAPKIQPYTPYTHVAATKRSPFTPQQGEQQKTARVTNSNGVHPNFHHKRGPLEHYPLDALKMVGTLESGGTLYALVSSPDGIVYRVTVGNYMGENYGKITKITQTGILLREIVPDGFGGYIKRPTDIALSGSSGKGSHS
jgi:type IV pilus assembly protein PilP